MQLARAVLHLTAEWPAADQFGFTQQARRAAVSIPANIAEGQGRLGPRELRHHLSIAHGSLCEIETLLELARDCSFSTRETLQPVMDLAEEVGRILRGFIRSLD